jgi:enoyl-CoA hydratase
MDVGVEEGVATLTLRRPEKLNAINAELHHGLADVWRQLARDPDVRVVVITGEGRAFSVGGDVDWFGTIAADDAYRYRAMEDARRIVTEMVGFARPVIAAVNGPAVGLGCSLAVLSDVVYMSDRSLLADPQAAIGLVAADGGALAWPLMTSLLRAKEYLFTGDRIPAEQAVAMGLANRVVAADELHRTALELATRLAAQPSQALWDTKRALNIHLSRAVAGVVDFAFAAESETMLRRALTPATEA